MEEGRRRSVRRICLAAAAVCTLLALAAPANAQDEDTVPPPEIWRGAAASGVATVYADRQGGLLPVPDIFRYIVLDGDSVYETDNQTARASLFYPGEGIQHGPNLACGTFGGQFPPQFKPLIDACTTVSFPLTVKANSSDADVNTPGAFAFGKSTDPISGDAGSARAHAAPDGSSTHAQVSDFRVLGLPGIDFTTVLPVDQLKVDPTVIGIGNATSTTDQRIDHGVLVVTSEAKLSGVKLVGGLVKIGAIVSTSTATDDGHGKRTAVADTEVTGVTVAGFPAKITEDGLVIMSPAGGLGPIKQQVQKAANQLLDALGVKLSLLDNVETKDDGTGLARAQAPGLYLEINTTLAGTPPVPAPPPLGQLDLNGDYVGFIQLASTGAAAGASNFEDEVIPPVVEPPVDGSGDGGFVPSDDGGDITSGDDSGAITAPETSTDLAAPTPTPDTGTDTVLTGVIDTFGGRLGLLYLAFAFTVLGLCIVPRLTLPARLPGPRS
jgi:hypothetical protein